MEEESEHEKEDSLPSVELKSPRSAIEEAKKVLAEVWEDGY